MGGRLFPNARGANWLPMTWGEASGGEREKPGGWAVPRLSSPRVARPASVGPGRATTVMGCRTEPGRA
jgi:hypothetical protein